jgi:hypothetical protein
MASVNGTIPTEGLPGAPTWTVFRVTTDRAGEATDVPGTANTDAAAMTSASARRFRGGARTFVGVSICSYRRRARHAGTLSAPRRDWWAERALDILLSSPHASQTP